MWIITKRDYIYKDATINLVYKYAPSSPALAYAEARADGTDCKHESRQRVLGTNNALNCLILRDAHRQPAAAPPAARTACRWAGASGAFEISSCKGQPLLHPPQTGTGDTMLQPHVWMRLPGRPDHLLLPALKYFMQYLLFSGPN